jgi:carbon-monoxide dehydrogenase large subunit
VVAPDVGGGFGEKGGMYAEELVIPYLAMRLGRPVKWVEERWENMLAFHGRGHTVDVEAAAQRDGTLLGLRVQIVADLGAYFLLSTPTVPILTSHRLAGPYKTPAMHVEVRGVITNKPPTGAYRGAGGTEAAFFDRRLPDLEGRLGGGLRSLVRDEHARGRASLLDLQRHRQPGEPATEDGHVVVPVRHAQRLQLQHGR